MERFDHVVIGFGKGGKTLAGRLAAKGQRVALIEKDPAMFGGTCINVACIPTKSLEHSARLSRAMGGSFAEKAARYRAAVEEKRRLTSMLREKNLQKAQSAGVTVLVGEASFEGPRRVLVRAADGALTTIEAETITINTGSRPFVPPIPGLSESRYAYTSETLMERDALPQRLVILGGGYIGVEFSSYFANFGSEVTILQDGDAFLPREDAEAAQAVLNSLEKRGIRVLRSAKLLRAEDGDGFVSLRVQTGGEESILEAEALLVATGRRPNVAGLRLENAGVRLTERGAVWTDERLRTSAGGIFAMGDVTGGLQFTYISLDDSRIVESALTGGERTTHNRGAVPYSVFLDPPLSRVGMTEEEARSAGRSVLVARLPAAAVPKAHILQRPEGLLKAIVDAETGRILGAHLFCAESQEMINLVKLAMDAGLPYTALRDAIYTHPTMSEALNDLFQGLKA